MTTAAAVTTAAADNADLLPFRHCRHHYPLLHRLSLLQYKPREQPRVQFWLAPHGDAAAAVGAGSGGSGGAVGTALQQQEQARNQKLTAFANMRIRKVGPLTMALSVLFVASPLLSTK